jgi:hypothetical protein
MASGTQVTVGHGAVLVNLQHLGSITADESGFHDEVAKSAAATTSPAADPARPAGPKDAWPTEHGVSSTWR